MGWYEKNIEPEVRDLVRYLRNNGVNTECSCGHEGYIQCQYVPEGAVKEIRDLVYDYFADRKEPIDYTIEVRIQVIKGHSYPSLDIKIPLKKPKG